MNRKNKKVLLLSLVIVLVLGVGVTIAYLYMSTQHVANTFEPTQVSCTVDESFNGTTKSDVKINSTSDIDTFIRAEIVITWKKQVTDGDGNISFETYGKAPVKGTDYTIDMNLQEDGWFTGPGNFYYYAKVVAPKEATAILINSCEQIGTAPDGYYLSVEIIAEAIQADGESFGNPTGTAGQHPAEIVWGVKVNTDDDGNAVSISLAE